MRVLVVIWAELGTFLVSASAGLSLLRLMTKPEPNPIVGQVGHVISSLIMFLMYMGLVFAIAVALRQGLDLSTRLVATMSGAVAGGAFAVVGLVRILTPRWFAERAPRNPGAVTPGPR